MTYVPRYDIKVTTDFNGVFPKWSRTFIEFTECSEFRESDKSLKLELVLFYNKRGGRFEPFNRKEKYFSH